MFRYEITMLVRDTRTLLITVVAPLILFPLFIFATNRVERSEERRLERAEYRYVVVGSEADWARQRVERALALGGGGGSDARFSEMLDVDDAEEALQSGFIHLVVESFTGEEYQQLLAAEGAEETGDEGAAEDGTSDGAAVEGGGAAGEDITGSAASALTADAPPGAEPEPLPARALRLRFRSDSDFSRRARSRLEGRLRSSREAERDSVFMARGFPVPVDRVIPVRSQNMASSQKEGGAILGLALTPALLLLMLTGGSIVAVDAISGEKERGTLETLLTTAATRGEIVWAKLLAVVLVGIAVAVVNVANLGVYLGLGVVDLPASLQIGLSFDRIALLFLLFVPLAVLVSGALLLLSGISRSYREYQIYFFPIFLVFLIPSLAPVLPGMDLRSAIALVPISGVAVAVREVMIGEVDLLYAILAFFSTGAAALWLAILTERSLSNERLISRSELDRADLEGGPALFPRHVLRWFLGFWVVFFIVSLWFGESLGVRGQILVNLVGIFLGGSVFLMWRYRLPVKETLGLRMPHPAVWVAVLIGAPSSLILGIGLAELINTHVFPIPDGMLEAFGESLAEPDLAFWELLLFLSILPGVLEEVAFRGVLLSGVRKRFGPWGTALLVGAIFGFFHVSLFRIVPTAWLGVILSGVVLLSGSILPAILWHALNNAAAIVPSTLGWLPEDFAPGPGMVTGAAVGLALAFLILWHTRVRTTTPPPVEHRAGASRRPARDPGPLEVGT